MHISLLIIHFEIFQTTRDVLFTNPAYIETYFTARKKPPEKTLQLNFFFHIKTICIFIFSDSESIPVFNLQLFYGFYFLFMKKKTTTNGLNSIRKKTTRTNEQALKSN